MTCCKNTHEASWRGHDTCVERFLDSGRDIDARDRNGLTPLMIACMYRRDACVELLVHRGADLELKDLCSWTCSDFAKNNLFLDNLDRIVMKHLFG